MHLNPLFNVVKTQSIDVCHTDRVTTTWFDVVGGCGFAAEEFDPGCNSFSRLRVQIVVLLLQKGGDPGPAVVVGRICRVASLLDLAEVHDNAMHCNNGQHDERDDDPDKDDGV